MIQTSSNRRLQAVVDVTNAQVVLDAVQSVLERVAFGASFGDGFRDSSDNGRDDEDAKKVVDRHEDALEFGDRVVHLAYGQKQHCRPVDAEKVVVGEVRVTTTITAVTTTTLNMTRVGK